jgi:hypothetical protein
VTDPLEKQSFLRRLTLLIGWLSPELYLRRPPAKNEQYRLDRMLQAAAQRGVRVNIIVYKEVTQALTRMYQHTVQDWQGAASELIMLTVARSVLLTHQARSRRPPSQYRRFPPPRSSSRSSRTGILDYFLTPKPDLGHDFNCKDVRRCAQGSVWHE